MSRYTNSIGNCGWKSGMDSNPIIDAWRIPCSSSAELDHIQLIKRQNRYLKHQQLRIHKSIEAGKYMLALTIFTYLVQRSKSFNISFINRISKGWYHSMSENSLKRLLNKLNRITSKLDVNVRSRRFYLPKPDGRTRPIGAPTLEWRIYLAMWNDFFLMFYGKEVAEWQHGFMPGRSILTAWKHIWSKHETMSNPYIYEFDLDGFFNRVSPRALMFELQGLDTPKSLERMLLAILEMYPLINWSQIQSEKELTVGTRYLKQDEQIIEMERVISKSGFPQGSPISPLLSVLLLSIIFKRFGLEPIMYADDGLLITTKPKESELLESGWLEKYGIYLSTKLKKDGSPSCGFVGDVLTFLGLSWNRKTNELLIGDKWIKRNLVSDHHLRGVVWKNYSGNNKPWYWQVEPQSVMSQRLRFWSWEHWRNIVQMIVDFIQGKRSVYRRFGFKCYNTGLESTLCSVILLTQWSSWVKPSRRDNIRDKFDPREPDVIGEYNFMYPQGSIKFSYNTRGEMTPLVKRDMKIRGKLYNKYYGPLRTTLSDPWCRLKGPGTMWS